jgi:peptidoglycan LD-endopeptidase LytH
MIAIPTLWLAMFLFIPATPQNPPEVAPASPQTPAPKSPETSSPAPAPKFPLLIPSRSVSPSPTPAPGASRPRRVKDDGKELRDLSSAPAPGASRPRRVNGNEPEKEPRDLPSQRVPDKWRLPLPHVSDLTPLPPPAITSSPEPAPKSAPISPPTPAPKSAPASPPASGPKSLASSPTSTPKSSPAPAARGVKSVGLIIPVEGGRPSDLRDTFFAARSGGRVHRAIDIMVPRGTRVLAATDGEIVRIGRNRLGGKIIYQLSEDKKYVFYYAHLDRFSDGLRVGDYVRQGDVIAYVGNTGNAGPGNYHLHFSVLIAGADPKKAWKGATVNPYPLLRRTKP